MSYRTRAFSNVFTKPVLDGFHLDHGSATSLNTKLSSAQAALDSGDRQGACGPLGAFGHAVLAQSGKKLTAAQAGPLLDMAADIKGTIGCP